MQPKTGFLGALGTEHFGKLGGIVPLFGGHEAIEARGLHGRLGPEFGFYALQLGESFGGVAQL
jgi:hypothetical protein